MSLLFLGSSCNLVAGLNDFQPPGDATGTAGSTSGEGGAGSVTGTSASMTDGVTTSGSGNPKGSSVSAGSGGAGSCADHLLINEVRIQDGDFVELYNPTGTTIDLEGMTLYAKTSGPSLGLKWTGKSGATLAPQSFYLLAASGGDDVLTQGIVSSDPTVVVLDSSTMQIIDSMCVCTSQTSCSFTDGVNEFCAQKALIAAGFHVNGDVTSAQRKSCNDSDDCEIDFGAACPTPSAPNFTVTTCQ